MKSNSWQDWKRTIISTATIVATLMFYYYNDRATMQATISRLEGNLNSHCSSVKNYSLDELNERFVTRREWENSRNDIKVLREDIRELSRKFDVLYNRLIDNSKK